MLVINVLVNKIPYVSTLVRKQPIDDYLLVKHPVKQDLFLYLFTKSTGFMTTIGIRLFCSLLKLVCSFWSLETEIANTLKHHIINIFYLYGSESVSHL